MWEGFGKRLRVRHRSVAHKKRKKGIKKKVNDVNTAKGKVIFALEAALEFATVRLLVTLKKGISLAERYDPGCRKIKSWIQEVKANFSAIFGYKEKTY